MKRKNAVILCAVLIMLSAFFLLSREKEYSTYIPNALGTVSEIKIYSENDKAIEECRDYIYKTDRLFSLSNPDSEISRLNNGESVRLSAETEEILRLSSEYTDPHGFNPFCGGLTALWDSAASEGVPPEESKITAAKEHIYPPALDISGGTARLTDSQQKINLGAIAKGYITDGINDILDEYDVTSALIYLGGNVYARGKKPGGQSWHVGVCDPDSPDDYLGIIEVEDKAVITSGDYERCFEHDGVRYHHIIDPETGYPAKSGLRSVTVICDDGAVGDMLSTACFIAGFEKSAALLREYGAYAIFVTEDRRVLFSGELGDSFETIGTKYAYSEF